MRILDPNAGPRAAHYAWFRSFAQPVFTVCAPVPVDVARLRAEGGLFPNLLWAVLYAVQQVPELRQRIRVRDGADIIVEHVRIDSTCTLARQDGSFAFGFFPFDADRAAFVRGVPDRIALALGRPGIDTAQQHRDDLAYLSTLPWIEISSVQHASRGESLDSVPRVVWGRVGPDGRMTVCLSAHHSLVDGRHVALFIEALTSVTR